MRILVTCLALAGVMQASADVNNSATGQQHATLIKPVTSFGYLDIDKDERLTRQEAKVDWAVAQRFAAADSNHDGYLDPEEFKVLSRG